jgi:hypothetical protein
MQILVDLDGVLKGRNDEPISTGILMIGALSAHNRLIFISSNNESETRIWLDINKIVDYDIIIDSKYKLVGEDLKQRQVNVARARGGIDMIITNDPNLWRYTFELGIPSSMFAVPSYTRVEFRPDAPKKVRAWDQIEEAIDKENQLRTQDARLSRTEAIGFE